MFGYNNKHVYSLRKDFFFISFIIIGLFAILPNNAQAYTEPYKLIVFTDKQVYLDYGYDLATGVRSSSSDNTKGSFNQRPNVFALLLDSDGNVVRGLTSANYSARLMDEERWNHSGAALNSYPYYQVIKTNGTYYPNASNPFPTFADSDNDGIFNSTLDVTDVNDLAGSKPPTTDQLNISINVTIKYQGVNYTTKVYVIFGTAGCYHPTNTFSSAHGRSGHSGTPCTTCHWGYQYALGTHGPNNSIMQSDPGRNTGTPTWTTTTNWDYRTGLRNGTFTGTTYDNSGAGYCMACHGGPTMDNILDLGVGNAPSNPDQNGDLINDGGRPSCSWYQGLNGTGCHSPQQGFDGSSKIVQSSLNGTDWKGWSVRPGASKSHNHSISPRTNGTPCELCHAGGGAPGTGTGGMHMVAGLPNGTTDYTNINDQCQICHNISDGSLNITANGGTEMNHTGKDQCSKCHVDNNRLDSHKVPTGAYGGKWCVNCHNLTGKAPIDRKVDENIINVSNSNYIHYKLNNKANAANSSRICWACHTNDSYITNGVVNSTLIPVDKHPGGFDTPRTCTACHNNSNASKNFSAPQNKKHTWYSQEMITPAVIYCDDCHAQKEMLNSWSQLISSPRTDNESSSHYGKNRSSFFGPLVGSREYCGYCHQNESTVMGPFANNLNKVRSDHASQLTTPGCGNSKCHQSGRLHNESIVLPNFTEANIGATCRDSSCHSPANYSFHNNTLTCWDCHMGNVSNSTWIHPIQFIQYNGNFTGAKLTGATCYDCHKSTRVDSTVEYLSNKTPKKVYGQAHSNDPMNGTKWGDYWKYTPTTYEFASYQIINGNGSITPAYPFDNIKVPSNDYMELVESRSGSSNEPVTVPYNELEREITRVPVPNWTSTKIAAGTTTKGIISTEQDATKGKPAGSLKASLKTGDRSGTYLGYVWWNYSFNYNPNTSQYAYTNASADYNITVPAGNSLAQAVYLRLVKPSGQVVILASASNTTSTGWKNLSNNSFSSALDQSGTYKLQLYTELQGVRNFQTYTVNYDNFLLKFQEKVWNRYELIINTTGVPVNGNSKLGMSYQVHTENASLMIFNKTSSSYEFLDTMNSGVFFDYTKNISSTHHIKSSDGITGNVSVKFIDDDKSDTDSKSDALHVRYLYVYTDRGLQYPCEQCHSPNKHYVNPTLGSPAKFSAGNQVNQTISSSSTWCQQCHWQGASNYSKMIQEFSVTRNPPENIPPEITGNSTFAPTGGARDGTPYLNHSGYDLSDIGCFGCHGGSLSPDEGMTAFIHDVSEGIRGGGRNCTSCHNIGGSKNNVNFSTIETSMHASLNNGAYSTPQNASNKPCWGCHGTFNGAFANESDQPESGHNTSVYKSPRKCDDCHITGRVMFFAKNVTDHISSGHTLETDVNTSSYNPGYCSSCHNNSVNNGFEADGMGIFGGSQINASVSHYGTNKTSNMLMAPGYNSTDCVFCHRNSSNMLAWGILQDSLANISNKNASSGGTDHNQYISSTQCSACHGGYSITPGFTFHDGTLGNGSGASGGPDCTMCHDVNGAQKKVNFSAMNDSGSIHKNLNNEAFASDNTYNESKKCWACHGDGSQPQGHPTQYKTPSNCTDCHTNASSQFAGLQVSRHYWNNSDIRTPAANSCYGCHNTSEMMLGTNLDPDGAGSIYGGENGGSSSTSHYGKKRPDYQSIQGTNDYCTRCHNNLSTVFPFIDTNNKTISNHSVNYPSTNPGCSDCHSTGRIHDNTLSNPKFSMPNSSYCETCHGLSGSAAIKNKDKHNGSVDCTQCHLNSSRNIHPVQYLQEDTTSWNTSKTNAINCTDCHRSGFANAPIIPDPSKHSNNLSNGSIWNNTAYWTTGSGSCYYCHNNTNHNSTALGTISVLMTNQNNTRKGQLTTTTWCADCHYNDVSNPYYKGDQWNPIPPLINKDNTNKDGWQNHSGYFVAGYTDSSCESCHAFNGSSSKDSMNYSHSLDAGTGGGPNCISCHGIGGSAPKIVNVTDIGKGIHNNLNGAAANANRSCYACHGDGNAPASGHPVEYTNPKKCTDCHSQGNYSAQIIQNHIPPKLANDPGRNISTNAYCTDCHNNSINNFAYTINGSVSHYGTNTTILKPTVNQTALPVFGFLNVTEAQDHNKECNNCHKNYPFNLTYGNATQIGFGHTSTGACDQCHLKGSASNLHNGSIIVPQTYSCLECHTSNASKYNAPNITGTIMATYPTSSCDINGCHGQGTANGLLDTIDKHNINVTFSGVEGNTGQVYLNGQNPITVSNGTQVLITSTVNDISGGGYYASRVGGAEYYIDTDPGVGKGIALYAEDGLYDALDGAWENVNATIDTTNLSAGIHTVYVRGMDIGKQWSVTQNASLTIKSSIPYVPPAPDSLASTQGNFWINYTWQAGIGNITESFNVSVNGTWTNGTNINYSNNSVEPHGWSNISVWAFNNSGNGSQSLAASSNNTQVANNNPAQAQMGNKTVVEGNLLIFTVQATDIDSDLLVNGTNATKGTFNPVSNQFNWTPGYGDQGTYFWNFNSNDNYGGTTGQTITVTVNNVPLSITTSTPVTDPTSTQSAIQSFTINLNRTSNVTWYLNGSIVKTNTSVISSNYANSTAEIGFYNVTALANDGFDTILRQWNWTVTAIPTYQVSGYAFDNYGIGLGDVLVQNATNQDSTLASGQYSITGLINGTYNFSFSKTGFNTEYHEVTINGVDITNANKTIFDTTPPGQVTGLLNDTPALTTINISWDPTAEANYYQVFRNTTSVGYTQNTYWNDTGLNSSILYEFMVRANDTYNNWGQNSSILNVITASPDTSAPASISNPNMTTGNFFINNTWVNPNDTDLDHVWFRYSNGTTIQNVSKPVNYLNLSYSVRYTQNISAQTVDTLGNTNQTLIWFNTTIPNNAPVQSPIGDKTINENQLLQINVTATDIDSDQLIYGTNATKGTFNITTGNFSWKPELGDAGIYIWQFNSSDSYGGLVNETITVTVNADPLGDCLSCHNSTQNGYPGINQPSFGKHMNVNTNQGKGILNNGDCITCHNDISNMFQPGYTTGTRTCVDCHTQGNFSAPVINNHRPGGVNINTTAYCSTCHINSINIFVNNSNTSAAHYSTNASLMKPTVNRTIEPVFGFMIPAEVSDHNRECSNCHNPSNASYGNATQITLGHTSTATCNQCHLNADADNLHNGSLIKPVTSDCKLCHTIYADIYKAPNLTTTDHGRSTYDCVTNNCHVQPDYPPKGKLNLSDHSVDSTFSPGNKPTTDLVSLNGSSSLTVYKGEIVAVSSRIMDNPYTASRVRGAEYYMDTDPGYGKGTVMSSIDGYFDASNGGWENITGSIDTLKLTPGNHTVYVRGMDIGKQWSTSVAAALIVLDSRGFVNGTVRNSTGSGIAGATVITNTGSFGITDVYGFYSLDLIIGTYDLTATKEPEFYANNTFTSVNITRSATEIREAVLADKPTGTISGVVMN